MSPLPERRKSPEELAKLRESLGIPPDGQPPAEEKPTPPSEPPAPREIKQLESTPTPEPEPAEEPVAEEAADAVPKVRPKTPPHSLRKSRSLEVDQPKPVRHREDGKLPSRRHTDDELMRMRRMETTAPPEASAAAYLARQHASVPLVLLFYGFLVISLVLALAELLWISKAGAIDMPFDWLRDAVSQPWWRTAVAAAVGATSVVALVGAGWLAWRRPLSRHHAGFLTIGAMLVLVFGTLYFFPNLYGA